MIDLTGRVALVTGASRGIGRAVAVGLAQAGADVAVNYRVQEKEANKTLEMIKPTGRRAIIVQGDVSNRAVVARLVETVEKELGPIDILVNNAGMARRIPMEEMTEADWDETMNVNLKSAFLMTQAVLPGMRSRHWGRVIMMSSGAALDGGSVGIHYSSSKGGMNSLARAYAKRVVKDGVTVNAVAPVLVLSDMSKDQERAKKIIPMERMGQPEEVADAVVMLAGNGYMTGQVLHLNGGYYFT